MTHFKNLTQEALLGALTEYYEKYRKIIELGGDEDDFVTSKFALESILDELNSRRGQLKPFSNPAERTSFDFSRIDAKAD